MFLCLSSVKVFSSENHRILRNENRQALFVHFPSQSHYSYGDFNINAGRRILPGVGELRYDEENICSLIKGIKPII
jgi:hypothetical protein